MKQVELTREDQKIMDDFLEKSEEGKMSFMEKIKQNVSDLWDDHKEQILAGVILGGLSIFEVLSVVHAVKTQKAFTKEVQAKYGPNATHGNIFGGSMSKRRADLEAWEQGNYRNEFDRVMEFAKTLHLGNEDSYTIEGFKNPDDEHIAVSVFQQCGNMFHSDWI